MAKILIIGAGTVGMAVGHLLSHRHQITYYDNDPVATYALQAGRHPLLLKHAVDFDYKVTEHLGKTLKDVNRVLIAIPTPSMNGYLYTRPISELIQLIRSYEKVDLPPLNIAVCSTVDIGFCLQRGVDYFPQFMSDAAPFALPERLIYGTDSKSITEVFDFLDDYRSKLFMHSTQEAELVKLGSNGFLATKLAFFETINEIAVRHGIDSKAIIRSIAADSRIGRSHTYSPFKIAGKCLPKDVHALWLASRSEVLREVANIASDNL